MFQHILRFICSPNTLMLLKHRVILLPQKTACKLATNKKESIALLFLRLSVLYTINTSMLPYTLYQSNYIVENQAGFIRDLSESAHAMYQYGIFDTSLKHGSYTQYNIFGVSSPSLHMWQLFKEIRDIAHQTIPGKRLWMQSWINHHYENELLGWHNHSSRWHGYVSIQPWNTVTEFDDYVIENKIGQIYLGPGGLRHRVVSLDDNPFPDKRITVAFDIMSEDDFTGDDVLPTHNFGCIPLL